MKRQRKAKKECDTRKTIVVVAFKAKRSALNVDGGKAAGTTNLADVLVVINFDWTQIRDLPKLICVSWKLAGSRGKGKGREGRDRIGEEKGGVLERCEFDPEMIRK